MYKLKIIFDIIDCVFCSLINPVFLYDMFIIVSIAEGH